MRNLPQIEIAHLKELFKQMSLVLNDFTQDVVVLITILNLQLRPKMKY